jgi:hypothetical protein
MALVCAACGNGGDDAKRAADDLEARLDNANNGVRRLRVAEVRGEMKELQEALGARTTFPIATIGPVPDQDCCARPHHLCNVDSASRTTLMDALGWFPDHTFTRFSYTSTDGRSFTATWKGDLICDGRTDEYVLRGHLDGTAARFDITAP